MGASLTGEFGQCNHLTQAKEGSGQKGRFVNSSFLSAPLHTIIRIICSSSIFEQRPTISGRGGGRPGVVRFLLRVVGPGSPLPSSLRLLGTGCAGPAALQPCPSRGPRPTRDSARFHPNEFPAERGELRAVPQRRGPQRPGESAPTPCDASPRGLGAWEGPRESVRTGPPASAGSRRAGAASGDGESGGLPRWAPGILACGSPIPRESPTSWTGSESSGAEGPRPAPF